MYVLIQTKSITVVFTTMYKHWSYYPSGRLYGILV